MILLLFGCVSGWCDRFNLDCEVSSVEVTPGEDLDGDLWIAGDDCDDTNPAINPLAAEVCDEVDNDCDERIDAADDPVEGLGTWYVDADEDGYGTGEEVVACFQPAGTTESSTESDCDDADASVHPWAEDVPYDGIDQDCADGDASVDLDGDGWGALEDCDDADPLANPGRNEICDDGVDQDCDPVGDCVLQGEYEAGDLDYVGTWGSPGGGLGASLAWVGEPGEEPMSFLVGMPFVGADPEPARGSADLYQIQHSYYLSKKAQFLGETANARLGASLDAVEEEPGSAVVLLGAPGAGGLVEGAGSAVMFWDVSLDAWGEYESGSANWRFRGDQAGDQAGASVQFVGDYDGDGDEDALVGAPGREGGAGAAWLLPGPLTDLVEESPSLIEGIAAGEAAGSAVLALDADGTGGADLAVGAPGGDAVYLLRDGEIPASLADAERFAGDAGSELGAALAEQDLDGDGSDELLVGAPGAGLVAVLGDEGSGLAEIARCTSTEPGDRAGASVSGAGDIDGDGYGDLVLGAPLAQTPYSAKYLDYKGGYVYVLYGPLAGGCELQTAWGFSLYGSSLLGAAVLGGGQLGGAAGPDLLLGAPHYLEPTPEGTDEGGFIALFTTGQ